MRKSNELQIGKAGEYIVCADIITKGLICFPSEQGLPYDVLIDTGKKLLRCQVKTTEKPREIPQRSTTTYAYIFNIKRHGKGNKKRYNNNEVDVFALVELENRSVAYLKNSDMPDTINLRVDKYRGEYYDEKGLRDYKSVIHLNKETDLTQTEISESLHIHVSTVNRMLKEGYEPHITDAKYFSDLYKNKEWFYGL